MTPYPDDETTSFLQTSVNNRTTVEDKYSLIWSFRMTNCSGYTYIGQPNYVIFTTRKGGAALDVAAGSCRDWQGTMVSIQEEEVNYQPCLPAHPETAPAPTACVPAGNLTASALGWASLMTKLACAEHTPLISCPAESEASALYPRVHGGIILFLTIAVLLVFIF